MKVKVTYECEETGQKMVATFREGLVPDSMAMEIKFEPDVREGVQDPFGVMGRIYKALTAEEG